MSIRLEFHNDFIVHEFSRFSFFSHIHGVGWIGSDTGSRHFAFHFDQMDIAGRRRMEIYSGGNFDTGFYPVCIGLHGLYLYLDYG